MEGENLTTKGHEGNFWWWLFFSLIAVMVTCDCLVFGKYELSKVTKMCLNRVTLPICKSYLIKIFKKKI